MVGQERASDLVAGKRAPDVLEQLDRGDESESRCAVVPLRAGGDADARQASHLERQQLQLARALERGCEQRACVDKAPGGEQRLGADQRGTCAAFRQFCIAKAALGLVRQAERVCSAAGEQRELGTGEGDGRFTGAIAARGERFSGRNQRPRGAAAVSGKQKRAALLRQRPCRVVGHVQRAEFSQRALEQRECFRQQPNLEVGIGQLLFGNGKLLRHLQLLIRAARALEAGQRRAIVSARQLEQRDRFFDHRLQHGESMRGGAHRPARVHPHCFIEIAERGERIGQSDIGHHRMLAIAGAREQHRGFAIVPRSRREIVATQMQAAQIQTHFGGGAGIAERHEYTLRLLGAGGGLRMLAEHRQCHDPRHLRLGRMMLLAEGSKHFSGAHEACVGVGHLPAREAGDSCSPFGQCGDFFRCRRRKIIAALALLRQRRLFSRG